MLSPSSRGNLNIYIKKKKKTFACTRWCPEVANLYKCCLFALYCQTVSMVDIQPKSHDSGKT